MNTPQHTTHAFSSPLGRDLFSLGCELAIAHKKGLDTQESLLNEMSMICEPPPNEPMSDEELAEMARYYEAGRARVNPHD